MAAKTSSEKPLQARLHHYASKNPEAKQRPIIVLVPGGGCFSAASWGPVDVVLRSFDVVTVDLPGTGGLPKAPHYTYEGVMTAIEKELNTLQRPLVISGMSFGATYAADLATRGKYQVDGFVGLVAPITVEGFKELGEAMPHNPHFTPAIKKSDEEFEAKPSEQTWKKMLEVGASIYFTKPFLERGTKMLLADKAEYQQYLDVYFPYAQGKIKANLLERIKAFKGTKILAAGEVDHLVDPRIVENDARRLGCKFETIPKAPHFILFEQPERTTELFEKYFLKKKLRKRLKKVTPN